MLANKQCAAVLVIDIDEPGTQGGRPFSLAEELFQLVTRGLRPAWVGNQPIKRQSAVPVAD